MTQTLLQRHIESGSKKKVELKINNNRSTMLSVRWDPDCTRVSIHKIFLDAPVNVMESLACYIGKKHKSIDINVRSYIEDKIRKLDYSDTIDPKKIVTSGQIHDLQKIFDQLNEQYFDNAIKLQITWFGKANQRNKSRITFGLYHDQLRLIKINRMLDSHSFPEYVVHYIIYHEMVHHVCPSYYDDQGIHRIHSKEFKEKEMEFSHYKEATEWLKINQEELFTTL